MFRHCILIVGIACGLAAPPRASAQADQVSAPAEAGQTLTLQVTQARLNAEDQDSPGLVLDIQLAPESTHAFARFTEDHVGQRLRLLADGQLLTSVLIMAPISTGRLRITPGVGEYAIAPSELRSIADKLSSKPAVIQARLLPMGQ